MTRIELVEYCPRDLARPNRFSLDIDVYSRRKAELDKGHSPCICGGDLQERGDVVMRNLDAMIAGSMLGLAHLEEELPEESHRSLIVLAKEYDKHPPIINA